MANLLDQSLWWLVPYALLMLAMLYAMMEFTASLLAQSPQAKRKPIAAGELKKRLLALNAPDEPSQLVEGEDCDLEMRWEMEMAPPPGRLAIATAAESHHLRFLLDERRHELRMHQVSRSYRFFLGLAGCLGWAAISRSRPARSEGR